MADTALEHGTGVWMDRLRVLLVEGLCFEQKVPRATKRILCAAEMLRHVTVLEMNKQQWPYTCRMKCHFACKVAKEKMKKIRPSFG
jgi:hypothetical protein